MMQPRNLFSGSAAPATEKKHDESFLEPNKDTLELIDKHGMLNCYKEGEWNRELTYITHSLCDAIKCGNFCSVMSTRGNIEYIKYCDSADQNYYCASHQRDDWYKEYYMWETDTDYIPDYLEISGMADRRVSKLLKIKKGKRHMSGEDAYSLVNRKVFVELEASDALVNKDDMYYVFEHVLNSIRKRRYKVAEKSLNRIIENSKKLVSGST